MSTPKKNTLIGHFMTIILDLLKSYPNCAKTFKFIDMCPDIERTRSQIMNDMKYMSIKKPREYFINDKIQLSYVGCISQDMKQPIHVKHHVQSNNVKQHVEMNEHAQNSTYIDIYNK
jgi:hypothetical protein